MEKAPVPRGIGARKSLAEEERFELSRRTSRPTVFKTAAFNRSATPPKVGAHCAAHVQLSIVPEFAPLRAAILLAASDRLRKADGTVRSWGHAPLLWAGLAIGLSTCTLIGALGSKDAMTQGMLSTDEDFRRLALDEARLAAAEGEVPIGAVVTHGGERILRDGHTYIEGAEVVARAHNRRETDRDPSAHAEFSALLEAARVLDRWRLTGCTVYVTLEPCLMCSGLMVNGRIDRCVFGAPDPKGGALGTLYDVSHDERLNHEFEVIGGVLAEECATELRAFFRERRERQRVARKAAAGL